MESLEELVDVAIDTGERVIYDEGRGDYTVLRHPVVYRFTPSADDVPFVFETGQRRADE